MLNHVTAAGVASMTKLCERCGSPLFEVIESTTTIQQIVDFLDGKPWYTLADVYCDGSPIAGDYCPDGCNRPLDIGGDGAIVEIIDLEEEEDSPRAQVMLYVGWTDIELFKVYVDGYIKAAANREKDADGQIAIEIEAGEHRIIVRENEVKTEGRLESNTLHFKVAEGESFALRLDCSDGSLKLVTN